MTDKTTSPPPAYFLSLSLENVRSFGEKQTISFARPDGRPAQWTIILGDNGVGKTTVLKALAALSPMQTPIFPKPKLTGPLEFNPPYASRFFESLRNKWDLNRNNWVPSSEDLGKGAGRIKCFYRIVNDTEGDFSLKSAPLYEYGIERNSDITWNGHFGGGSGFGLGRVGLIPYGYGAGRSVGSSSLSETSETDDTCLSLFDEATNLLNPEEWFLQMEYSSLKENSRAAVSLKRVRRALLKVLPDVTDIQIKTTEKHQQQLELETPYGWVRLRDMSLGYQTLVVWLTDFASKLFIRYPDSKNPLEEPAIVLIDEIDLHLHPNWQRKLIGFLSGIFKNTQFIATAHSPLVVQSAGDEGANVVLLKREGDQTKVYQGRDLPDVRHWRLEQIFSSELFDDTPPLSPQTEADLTRRNELLLKKRLTAKEKDELARLNTSVADQPVGTTRPERRAEDLLAQLARNLGKSDLLE
ncbi:AAA family ATPase [Hymenobacter terrenus]|uniref:AAA family ATPase n=1 Tax=Hymenobacter terrenus TaxID=1629124 RepID=UPI000AA26680|nr:AAA family ATPase [Hymenobacter terrenus]